MEEVEEDLNHMLGVHDKNFTYSLFAYPAEDNFAGVKYPLSWIKKVQDGYFQDVCNCHFPLLSYQLYNTMMVSIMHRVINGLFCLMLLHLFPPIGWTCQ